MDWTQILTATLGVLGTVMAVLIGNHKNKTVWEYKIGELEKKMDKHNNLVVRITETERDVKSICHRLDEIEEVLPRTPKQVRRNET